MNKSDFLRSYEQSLEIEPGQIKGTELFSEVEWWDSMAALVFIAQADQELKVSISATSLQQCKGVPDLLALLGDKLTP